MLRAKVVAVRQVGEVCHLKSLPEVELKIIMLPDSSFCWLLKNGAFYALEKVECHL